MVTVLLVIAILVVLVVVHEFGHFLTAKLFRIRVDEFGVGYPPRAFLVGRFGETDYTLNWIPFGGFVRLFGEDSEHGRGSFIDAPRYQQAIVLVAGVAMNALIAIVLFTGAYMIGILHPVDAPGPDVTLIVSRVVAGSPAEAAGLRRGDQIISVADSSGASAALTPDAIADFNAAHGGKALAITYVHNHATSSATVIPAHAVVASEAGRPAIGIGLVLVTTAAEPFSAAVVDGWYQTIGTFGVVFQGLGTIIGSSLHGTPNLSDVAGPIGIVSEVSEAASEGWGYVLELAGFISVNLVVINLIPIPALDGGRLVIVGIEGVLRRAAPKLAVQSLNTLGVALLIILMVVVTYHDVVRLIA